MLAEVIIVKRVARLIVFPKSFIFLFIILSYYAIYHVKQSSPQKKELYETGKFLMLSLKIVAFLATQEEIK